MLGDTLYLDNIEEYVQDENKIVTYKWLSRTLEVPVDSAKKMLYAYVAQCRSNDRKSDADSSSVNVTYLVTGVVSNGEGKEHQVCLINENKLEDTKKQFSSVLGVHIYSVQKNKLKDACSLYAADYDIDQQHVQDYSRWSNIECPASSPVRTTPIKEITIKSESGSTEVQSETALEHRPSLPKLSHMEEKDDDLPKNNLTSKKQKIFGKKSKAAAKGSVESYFSKVQNAGDTKSEGRVKVEEKVKVEDRKVIGVKTKEKESQKTSFISSTANLHISPRKGVKTDDIQPHSAPHLGGMFQGLHESDIDDGDSSNEDDQITKKEDKPRQPAQSKKRFKDTKQKTSQEAKKEQQRKRKRIQDLPSDEDFSDNENLTYAKKSNDCVIGSHVGKNRAKRRKRVNKLISKMYMNDAKEMVTEKSWELVSTDASDSGEEGTIPSRLSTEKNPRGNEGSSISVKLEKQSPSKQKVSMKQSSLMSFFKK